jgi:hypothetical protein
MEELNKKIKEREKLLKLKSDKVTTLEGTNAKLEKRLTQLMFDLDDQKNKRESGILSFFSRCLIFFLLKN